MLLCASIVVLAEVPKAEDVTPGNGFYLVTRAEGSETNDRSAAPSPVTVVDTDEGLKVSHGGYYETEENWGGIAFNKEYDLNGLEITILFEKMPAYTEATDGWFAVDFLKAPTSFSVSNFNVEEGGNQGIEQLIIFPKPCVNLYIAISEFARVYNSEADEAQINEMFAFEEGSLLKVKVTRNKTGEYELTYSDGKKIWTAPYAYDLTELFPEGKAYPVVMGSCFNSTENGFVYYITDITNGEPLTEEEIAAIAEAKAGAEIGAKTEVATKEIDAALSKVEDIIESAKDAGEAAIAKAAEAKAALDAAKEALEAQDFDTVSAKVSEALDLVKETKDTIKAAAKEAKEETKAEETKTEETKTEEKKDTAAPAASGSFPWLWIILAAVVVCAVVVILVASKKKK
ncbi:MAG: hypothetical protein IKX77_02930 [Clostridia bacterium]|nr:hypothetical protein [Clostridia bacterium]